MERSASVTAQLRRGNSVTLASRKDPMAQRVHLGHQLLLLSTFSSLGFVCCVSLLSLSLFILMRCVCVCVCVCLRVSVRSPTTSSSSSIAACHFSRRLTSEFTAPPPSWNRSGKEEIDGKNKRARSSFSVGGHGPQ